MPVFPEVCKQIYIKRLFHPPLNCSHFSQKSVYQSLVTQFNKPGMKNCTLLKLWRECKKLTITTKPEWDQEANANTFLSISRNRGQANLWKKSKFRNALFKGLFKDCSKYSM